MEEQTLLDGFLGLLPALAFPSCNALGGSRFPILLRMNAEIVP
jgi:hypothetical protein